MQTYGDYTYEPVDYVTPVDITISIADLEKENAELEARNQQLLVEIQQIQQNGKADSNRRTIAYQKDLNVKLTEAQTRELIDEQLRKVGWEVDTKELRYSKRTRPTKGKNLAIAEWPTDSSTGNNGYADYALFIGEKMVGIIEARKKHTNISSVLDGQCKDYAKHIKAEHQNYVIKAYGQYLVPFLFATNGREYIKQYEDMSGIWFLDTRESFNAPKALSGWPSPEGIEQDLERDIAEADKTLAPTGYELLEDPNGLNLRYYQIEAIKAAEKAIADKQRAVLLAMATGIGKTRTVLGMIYRFLSAKSKDGLELKKFYEELLRTLGEDCTGRIQEIYNGARSNIEEPANLKKIITNIDGLDWYSAKEEGLGNFYEGLLEKNANEKKSGAGQYFTHRVALPVYSESGSIERYNIVRIEMLIRHASDDKLYLYDMVNKKKETGNPFQQYALR